MNRIKMGRLEEIPPGSTIEKRILARRVLVVNDNGTLYGIEGDCKHMKATLASGPVRDGVIKCKWHGWKYELATGKCLTVDKMNLKTYDIEVEDGVVYIIM